MNDPPVTAVLISEGRKVQVKPERDDELTNLYGLLREERVDDFTRNRLIRRVMGALEVGEPASLPALGPRVWIGPSLAAAAALVLVLSGIFWLRSDRMSGGEDLRFLSVQANGGIHLEWTDAGRDRYQILKSTDPADFSRAERREVRGTRFIDGSPDAARVVYYRVE